MNILHSEVQTVKSITGEYTSTNVITTGNTYSGICYNKNSPVYNTPIIGKLVEMDKYKDTAIIDCVHGLEEVSFTSLRIHINKYCNTLTNTKPIKYNSDRS